VQKHPPGAAAALPSAVQGDPQPQHPSSPTPPAASASLTEQQRQQLHTYLDYMLEINQNMNLTGALWMAMVDGEQIY
jgi:hypothetical protein